MKVEVKQITGWDRCLTACKFTSRRDMDELPSEKTPTPNWINRIIRAGHSPIRLVTYDIYLFGVETDVATHLARHHVGVEKFILSNRDDRGGLPPEQVNRLTPVNMMINLNAEAVKNISHARLCKKAAERTRKHWVGVSKEMKKVDPIMAKHMVPMCVHLGFCPEMQSCGYCNTKHYERERKKYIE